MSTGQRGQAPPGAALADTPPVQQAAPPPSLYERAKSYLPSARTAMRVGGGTIGGAIGTGLGAAAAAPTIAGTPIGAVGGAAIGGAAGSSIGESLYQLAARALGRDDAPETPGAVAQAQTGALLQGVLQEGLPGYIASRGPQHLEQVAARRVAEAVKPSSLGEKANIQKVAADAIQGFPVASRTSTLLTKLQGKASAASRAVEDAYTDAAKQNITFQSQPVIQALSANRAKYIHNGDPIPGLESVVKSYDDVMDWLVANPNFNVSEFRKAKQAWDKSINWYRSSLGPDPAKQATLEEASGLVRDAIHGVFPSVAKADKNAHVWITLRDVLNRSDIRGVGKEGIQTMLTRQAPASLMGAGAMYATGGSPMMGAVGGMLLSNLPQTTLWNTLSVAERAALIRLLESQGGKRALHGIAALGSGTAEELIDRNTTRP